MKIASIYIRPLIYFLLTFIQLFGAYWIFRLVWEPIHTIHANGIGLSISLHYLYEAYIFTIFIGNILFVILPNKWLPILLFIIGFFMINFFLPNPESFPNRFLFLFVLVNSFGILSIIAHVVLLRKKL